MKKLTKYHVRGGGYGTKVMEHSSTITQTHLFTAKYKLDSFSWLGSASNYYSKHDYRLRTSTCKVCHNKVTYLEKKMSYKLYLNMFEFLINKNPNISSCVIQYYTTRTQ